MLLITHTAQARSY